MGLLAGETKLRRIVRWSKRHLGELQKHMPFPKGVPSVSAMSRIPAAVDEELVSLALINWIGEISNTRTQCPSCVNARIILPVYFKWKIQRKENIPDVIEDVCDNLEIGFKMIFQSIPSRY